MDKRNNFERSKDKINRSRNIGFSRYQKSRGKSYKFSSYSKKLDTRKKIFKPYGRSNLSMVNRKFYNRGNDYFSRNKKKILNKFDDKRRLSTKKKDYFSRKLTNSFRNRRIPFRSYKRKSYFRRENKNLHGRIGKLNAQDLDAELDMYMGKNNIKTRLNNDLDNYFKNNAVTSESVDVNK